MDNCDFETLFATADGFRLRCLRCGFELTSPSPAEATLAPCGAITAPTDPTVARVLRNGPLRVGGFLGNTLGQQGIGP